MNMLTIYQKLCKLWWFRYFVSWERFLDLCEFTPHSYTDYKKQLAIDSVKSEAVVVSTIDPDAAFIRSNLTINEGPH